MQKRTTCILLALLLFLFTAGQGFAEESNDSLKNEFMEAYLSTRERPFLNSQEEAWNWACDQVRSFRQRGLDEELIFFLEANMIQFLPEAYIAHFEDFLALSGNVNPVIIACEERRDAGDAEGAKQAIEPWIKYMDEHPEAYAEGKYCLTSPAEVALFMLETGIIDLELTDLNYTALILEYCKVLNASLESNGNVYEKKSETKLNYLKLASEMSPCNARVWEALAGLNTDEYNEYIEKALLYSTDDDTLASVYANLALKYSANDKPELADALCTLCERYGGNALAAKYVLIHTDYEKPADYEALIKDAGIQIGFSEMASRAIKIADS